MKTKSLLLMFALVSVLPLAAQTEANDTAQFVVVYDYECRTQDRKGEDVTDKMQVGAEHRTGKERMSPIRCRSRCRWDG